MSFDGTSIHGNISQVGQQLLRAVLGLNELEKLWRVINELEQIEKMSLFGFKEVMAHCGPGLSFDKNVVSKKAEQEWDVCLQIRE